MSYLVDANVLSEATRTNPDREVLEWIRAHESDIYISVITVGELQRGVALCPQGTKRSRLDRWLRELLEYFEGRILPIDSQVAIAWGNYYAEQQQRGRKPPSLDRLLAATARVHQLTIATRNVDDFPDMPLMNPWKKKSN